MILENFLNNITNPTILFFLLGIVAVVIKSTLSIPEQISKFLSFYLLFSIGFKGGIELAHAKFTTEILFLILSAISFSFLVPVLAFKILNKKLNPNDAGAIAATYGSVSAVTFVTASSYLDDKLINFGGYMVAVMALMEAPAIISGVLLIKGSTIKAKDTLKAVVHEAFTNGSVLLIIGSLIIGLLSNPKQAETIKPFTSDIFKGFLALFLLDMGIVAAKRLSSFKKSGIFLILFGVIFPFTMAIISILVSKFIGLQVGDAILLSILVGSASYIAVPAAMRLAVPDSDPGLFIPMALGVTFPFNLLIGIPLYTRICQIYL